MLHRSLVMCLLSLSVAQTIPTETTSRKGRNFTLHPSQLTCSLPGPEGPPGYPGPAGCPGASGRMGIPGKDGPDGQDGEKGEGGDGGDQGRPGNPGKPGDKGQQGIVGKAGSKGLKGARGKPGLSGQQGVKGEAGEAGDPGARGGCNCSTSIPRSAFTAAITRSYPKERRPIAFERVLLDAGAHFNGSSGVFVCTVPGVYFFSYDVTLAHRHLAIGLVHNGRYRVRTLDGNTGNQDVASGSTLLRLRAGDRVWLQVFYSEQNGLFFDPFWTDSLFTGFLIYPDQDFLEKEERSVS